MLNRYLLFYNPLAQKLGGRVKNQQGMAGAKRIFFVQLVLIVVCSVAVGFFSGMKSGLSILLGGLTYVLPQALFARKLFRYHGAKAAKQIATSFYRGEAVKILSSILLFIVIFIFIDIQAELFFLAYILTQMIMWFSPLLMTNKKGQKK